MWDDSRLLNSAVCIGSLHDLHLFLSGCCLSHKIVHFYSKVLMKLNMLCLFSEKLLLDVEKRDDFSEEQSFFAEL